jgi:predicted AAA+ superfamily ATPase
VSTVPLLRRRALASGLELLADARVVVVNGPRQAGKSELLRMIQRQVGGRYLTRLVSMPVSALWRT